MVWTPWPVVSRPGAKACKGNGSYRFCLHVCAAAKTGAEDCPHIWTQVRTGLGQWEMESLFDFLESETI